MPTLLKLKEDILSLKKEYENFNSTEYAAYSKSMEALDRSIGDQIAKSMQPNTLHVIAQVLNIKAGEIVSFFNETAKKNNVSIEPIEPRFQPLYERINVFSMGIGEIQNLEYYKDSNFIPEQLAYNFYAAHTNLNPENFLRNGDNHKFSGINGLSEILAILLKAYITGKAKTKTIHVFYNSDREKMDDGRKPEIALFNSHFSEIFSLQTASGDRLIYTVLI